MMLHRAGAAGRRCLALAQRPQGGQTVGVQGQGQAGRGLATLPTPKFFDYQARKHLIWLMHWDGRDGLGRGGGLLGWGGRWYLG